MSSIDQKIGDWFWSLPEEDLKPQLQMYFAYRKVMDKPLALWYVQESYNWEKKHKEMYRTR